MTKTIDYMNSKAMDLITSIIENEDLRTIKICTKDTALGDTIIIVKGDEEELEVLADIYNMVK